MSNDIDSDERHFADDPENDDDFDDDIIDDFCDTCEDSGDCPECCVSF